MSGFRIEGGSGNVLDVTTGGEVKVSLSNTPANIGGVRLFSENDAGARTGTPHLTSPETSQDYRLRVGIDTNLFTDEFNATAQNTANWFHRFTTMTMVQSGGFLVTNNNLTATTNTGCSLQTKRVFPLVTGTSLYAEANIAFTAAALSGQEAYFGFGDVAAVTAAPADGVWFKVSSAGITGVITYSGTPTESGVFRVFGDITIGRAYKLGLVVNSRSVEFWIDDELHAILDVPAATGMPFMSTSLPAFFEQRNSAAVSGSPQMQLKISNVAVQLLDIATNKTWASQMAGMGLNATQGQNGGTMGQTAQWGNAANPTAAAATNTTAALGAALGGLFLMNAPATGATDLIVASYQNPAGSVTQTPSTMLIRGVWVDVTVTGAAVATTATVFPIALAYGHTAVSLATAESASFTNATAKAPRRMPIGTAAFLTGAAIGQTVRVAVDFETPIVVNPTEFVAVVAKPYLSTATASQVYLFNIGFNAYYE